MNQKKRPRAMAATATARLPITMPAIAPPERLEDDFDTGADDVVAGPAVPAEELDAEGDAVVGLADVVGAVLAELDAGAEVVGFDEAEEAVFRTTTLGLETCSFCSLVKLLPAGRKRKVQSVLMVNWVAEIETTHEIDCVAFTLTPAV